MRALVVPDAFKGTLSAAQVAAALAAGLRAGGAEADVCPAADGGEGTLAALAGPLALELREVAVHDALGRPVRAAYGVAPDGATAVVETAAAIGIAQLRPDELAPLTAGSRGAGELMRHALDAGAHRLLVAVGGSATVDGGAGLLEALGGPDALRGVEVEVLCDVATPFERAAAVYGPQKGASPADVTTLAARLDALATRLPRDPRGVARTGAAGGISGALWACGATLVSGAERVLDLLELDRRLAGADVAIAGEGRLDAQTAEGKLVAAVAARARRADVPVVAVVGRNDADAATIAALGLRAVVEAGTRDALAAAGERIARA